MLAERKIATVFGGSGFLGRHVVQRLATAGYIVRIAVRDPEGARFLQTAGRVAQVVPLYAPVTREDDVARAVRGADVVVNLAGILAESRPGDFARIHAEGAGRVARLAAAAGVRCLVHVSALGAAADSRSAYARSKAEGEAAVRAAFPAAAILRPSVIFGAEDAFFNRFAAMAGVFPAIPIVHGATLLQPVYVADVAQAVCAALAPEAAGKGFELGGPERKSFRELVAMALHYAGRPRPILDLPPGLARLMAVVLERLPGKALTGDQITLLARDNVTSGTLPGLEVLGIAPTALRLILPAYLARYRAGGKGLAAAFQE